MSAEWRCPFIRGNKYKDYRNISIFRDQNLCPLNRGVPKERFHCIDNVFVLCSIAVLESLSTSTAECGCKLLTVDDYVGLLWTTFAEFPGES